MANTKTAKKRIKVIAARTMRNKAYRSSLRTAIKKADLALTHGTEDKAEVVRSAIKKIDQAVSKGILHKNTAARKKSQLAKRLNQVQAG
ncbi:MAG TPA: 30S ribosomal protein S20 [Clostridiales bacterium]|nr:30S ribosomal protein S20 [Clostridiales bacterium]